MRKLEEVERGLKEQEAEADQRVTQLKGELMSLEQTRAHQMKQLKLAQDQVRAARQEEGRKDELAR